jgi:hypothetical protein
VLEKYGAKREAYHGGDFNGVSCRHLVANISAIMEEFHPILLREKEVMCLDEEANEMCNPFLSLCGLIYGAFSSLLIIAPTESEILDADKKLKRLMEEW